MSDTGPHPPANSEGDDTGVPPIPPSGSFSDELGAHPGSRAGWEDVKPLNATPPHHPPISPPAEPRQDATPAATVVVRGRVCLSCGYDLTGLLSDAFCPECGAPVERSLRGNLLRYSSPDYVRTLRTGVLIAEIAALAAAGVTLMPIGGGLLQGVGVSPRATEMLSRGASIIVTILMLVGWWIFSTPDPAGIGDDRSTTPRKLLRVSLIIEMVLTVAKFGAAFLPGGATAFRIGPGTMTGVPVWAVIIAIGSSVLGLAAYLFRFFTSMFYLRSVAMRIPDPRIDASAARFMWLGPVLVVASPFTCFLTLVVAYVLYIVILEQTRAALQATLAEMEPLPEA